ncbi:MAG: hypothetical protein ABS68_00125 [Niastella sp. SCN 39-18]|nr:hypothetical protein [Sphingobacteriales bacterium]ODT55159.1 MAG: hypothetical protein ABS68_00125 [Niastella sp. SCN 39-18]OJW09129.1 MAG: hypothetical protein BGO53_00280 [Sphingobacteriales bacterium 39-19]
MHNIKITFEDWGQDFLEFICSENGEILDVQPFQHWVWKRFTVNNIDEVQVGGFAILHEEGEFLQLRYPIEKIERIEIL